MLSKLSSSVYAFGSKNHFLYPGYLTSSFVFSKCSYSNNAEHLAHHKPAWVPFYNAKYGNFVQEAPVLENQYVDNVFMQKFLKTQLPREV